MKKGLLFILVLLACTSFLPVAAFADHGEHDKECSMSGKDCDDCEGYKCPIVAKIMKKSGFFLKTRKKSV